MTDRPEQAKGKGQGTNNETTPPIHDQKWKVKGHPVHALWLLESDVKWSLKLESASVESCYKTDALYHLFSQIQYEDKAMANRFHFSPGG